MILDGAGWHCAHKLRWPRRITPLFLPLLSPELNPVERLWHWLCEHHGSNRTYLDEQALVDEAIRSHGLGGPGLIIATEALAVTRMAAQPSLPARDEWVTSSASNGETSSAWRCGWR